ncbi:PBP GOBP domain containing protein [Asbolus verrucosus]|uniref:PBP GOBP domain containing protein n=1 Tax=Asbolus verrucosus TaxID=1661398 RepID=A0A482VFJ1_ASBVE|nr:PBP GOBP domain containing protein [Asbolus verrucosus]
MKEMAKKMITECKTKSGASDADLEMLTKKKVPESHEGLCMLECLLDTSEIMDEGRFSKDGMTEGFKMLAGDDEAKAKNFEELASTCDKEIGDGDKDKCVTAKLVMECIMKNAKFSVPQFSL